MDHRQQIDELIAEAGILADGPTKVALFERSVQIADAHQDLEAGYRTRQRLMGAALSAGLSDVLLVSFTWCLAQSERDPQAFPEQEILWQFRWVISELVEFPEVSRAQLDDLFTDMERRYRRAGSSMRAYWVLRRMVALDMGDRDAAIAAHEQLELCRRDWLSDGADAETSFHVDYLLFLGQDEAGLRRAMPLLQQSQASSHHLGFLYAKLLHPLLKLGRFEQAARFHQAGYRLVSRNARYVPRFAEHLTFLALTENFARGYRLVERHLGDAVGSVSAFSRMQFYHSARLLFELAADRGRDSLRLRLPPPFPFHSPEGRYDPRALAASLAEQVDHMARQFDTRNGTDYYTRLFAETPTWKLLARPLPLPGPNAE